MKNTLFKTFVSVVVALSLNIPVFSGGLPEDNRNDDVARELAKTQNELDKEKNRGDSLEKKLDELSAKVNDLSSKEPVAQKFEWPIHGYFSSTYADADLASSDGTFDQTTLDLFLNYSLSEKFLFYADIGFRHGAEVNVDLSNVYGVGSINIYEAWLDWKIADENFVLKIGKFKTPFGVWMPEEIPPTSISVFDPLLVRWTIVPLSTTGIQEYGLYNLGEVKLSQKFYVGNGKSFRPDSGDENTNKAIGSRVGLIVPIGSDAKDMINAGISGYLGRDGRDGENFQEKAYGLDASATFADVTLRLETIKSRTNADDFAPGEEGHIWRFAWFAQLSYHFLEKFDVFYRHDVGDSDYRFVDSGDIRINSVGASYRPIEPVIFKIEYDKYSVDDETLDKFDVISGQVAVKF